jgi:subfamily B ATP-binding cassette protein MsbA
VSFNYGTQERATLDDVSFKVAPGEMVALAGPSGSGKTTLVNLLPRFFDPAGGQVLVDGASITEYALHDLRAQIAMVSQDVVLFNDTIAANVAYGTVPDRDRVLAALAAANLSDVIGSLPDGIDTLIGGNGMRLSGGQRQRLAIARAIYKDAPILILDEATSALDSESERHVQSALETLMKGRTTLVIAHRLSTIERADRILVLEAGKIAEQGSHAELLRLGGLYAHLHRIQYQQQAA